ncbi:MAG: cellulase family glycosylhydrolase [Burkholderiales bacterium]|nr:cellulase family glycosylhydrolase [Phycisphaerae bacterium]
MLLSATAPRPAYNTGTGFFVSGTNVYDANGQQFVMRGFNHTTLWGNSTYNLAAIKEFPKTGANAVRAVMGTFGVSQTPAQRQQIVESYIAGGIVPIVEDHMATVATDLASLDAVVDRWLLPGNVAWLKQYERSIILNIANEWGPDSQTWRDGYISSIARIRAAGINALIMVDAGGKGQNIHTIDTWATDVQAADPQHNVLFSIHLYEYWRSSGATDVGTIDPAIGLPWDVKTELTQVRDAGLPMICGEFSWDEASFVEYDTREAMQAFEDLDMGWLAWSWNQNDDTRLNMVASSTAYQYNSDNDLSDFGKLVINEPALGLKATAKKASIFSTPPSPNASLRGICFNDSDKDGIADPGESKSVGKTVFLDADNDGALDPGEKSVLTDSAGAFAFTGLAAGLQRVRRVFPSGYTYSTQLIDLNVIAGQNVTGLLIGSKPGVALPPPPTSGGSISGFLFFDVNKNSKFDAGEAYQSGKTVFIDLDGDNVLDANEKKFTTDAKGAFKFGNLAAGTFKVRRVVPAGYKVTTPARNVSLTAGQNVTGVAIGTAAI